MDDESKVQQDATNLGEELELDINLDDIEDVSAQAQDTVSKEKFRQVLARAKKAEEALKKQKSVEKPQNINNNVEEKKVDPLAIIRDESFKLFREGYDEDEIELILRNGGRKILSDEKNPITLGLRAKREQLKAEEAASMTNNSSSLSEVERKYTPEQLEKMPLDKLEETLRNAG